MKYLAPVSLRLAWIFVVMGLCLGALPPRAMAAESQGAPRLAWVVGNAHYVGMTGLNNPINDAQDVCQALQRLRFKTLCHVDVPDRASLLRRFAEFTGQLTPDTQGLVYYAGHAVQIHGRNYLVPVRASIKSMADVPRELVDVQELLDAIGRQGNAFTMVTLDACRDDPFVGPAAQPAPASLLRGLGPHAMEQSDPTGDVRYGLSAIRDAPRGTIVLYATGANDVALDGKGRNGLLTKHLLAHMETTGITVEDMIKRVGAGVQKESGRMTRRQQTPFVYSSFTGEFCFVECPKSVDGSIVDKLKADNLRLQQQLLQSPGPVPAASIPSTRPLMPATF